jgi:hypothetical protein
MNSTQVFAVGISDRIALYANADTLRRCGSHFTACCSNVMFDPTRCSKKSSACSPPQLIAVAKDRRDARSMA